jgi:gas vesicle protein
MEENVKNQLDAISVAIDSKIEKGNAQAVELASQKSAELVKEQVGDVVAKFNERMDAMEVANKKQMNAGKKNDIQKRIARSHRRWSNRRMLKGNSRSASLVVKADMTIGADFTGEVIQRIA